MLRILIPVVLLIIGLGGGLGAGLILGGGSEDMSSEDGTDEGQNEAEIPESDPEEAAEDDAGLEEEPGYADEGPVSPGSDANLEYVRLNNQFVVPVVRDMSVRHLVVMSLTVEIEAGQAELVFNREPRLRDAMLRVMFSHANAGGFEGSFTTPSSLNPLRSGLRDAAYDVLGPIVNDVLIVEIVRQDT